MMDAPPARPGLLERLTDEAHLWLTLLEAGSEPEEAWRPLLSPEEEAANNRFRAATARREHLAARGLVRTTLSRYVDVDPRRWRFREGAQGRPEIERPERLPPLRFNLSHTRGLVACVVTLGLDAGVDVERPQRDIADPLALAEHSFAPAEQEALRGLSGRALGERFCDLWTLKEAHVKARGAGFLSLPARRFAYEIDAGGIGLTLDPELAEHAGDWQSLLLAPTEEHRLAVVIRRGRRPDLELAAWTVAPGAEPSPARPRVLARSPVPGTVAAALSTAESSAAGREDS